jgi:hypothetical protein
MTENVQLKIVYNAYGGGAEDNTNEFMKDKNVLATQVVNGQVWIWYKTTPDKGYDGFSISEEQK